VRPVWEAGSRQTRWTDDRVSRWDAGTWRPRCGNDVLTWQTDRQTEANIDRHKDTDRYRHTYTQGNDGLDNVTCN